jgi:hypothetical protein
MQRKHLTFLCFLFGLLFLLFIASSSQPVLAQESPLGDKTGVMWEYLEWSLTNSSWSGNPFDLVATVTFTHQDSGETRTTEMFYGGDNTWKFRFTGTRTGMWTFTTSSSDPELDGYSGTVTIDPNPNPNAHGFIKKFGDKWGWQGVDKAFVPQIVMYDYPSYYHNNPSKIDNDIQMFLGEHGFNGFHAVILCHWFDIDQDKCNNVNNSDPDPRTLEALELLISKTHAAGGMVHIWTWGDEQRDQTIKGNWGGINGAEDKRLQRYIAARLGPLPGWTMGYGFDLDEWVSKNQIHQWHDNMHSHLGWSHFLGGRPKGPNRGTDHSPWISWNEGLDYSSYEHHQPNYEVYVAAINTVPDQPVMSEDRFRLCNGWPDKDYTEEDTRQGLYISTMAGGVANIWGYLCNGGAGGGSGEYPNKQWIKTYSVFFENRFLTDMVRDNSITNGYALRSGNTNYVFYKEDTSSIQVDLSNMVRAQPVVAVDTNTTYSEVNLGVLDTVNQTIDLPYPSDWAIAVGNFADTEPVPTSTPTPIGPTPTPTVPPPGSDLVISNLSVASGKAYVWDTLAVDKEQYIDRNYTFSSIPMAYQGLAYLRTANGDKASTVNPLVTFDVNQNVMVYVVYDNRNPIPAWLSGFTDMGDDISGGGFPNQARVLSKNFPIGTIQLGGNENGGSMYNIIVKGQGSGPTPTPEPTVTPTQAIPNPITLTLDGPNSVNLGETFSMDVIAQDVPSPGLYGVQFEINYDPAMISVSNLEANPNLSFVVLNDADNTVGKIRLVASQQGKVPGLMGNVTLLSFEATAADTSGTVALTFENEKFSDSQAQGFDNVSKSHTVSIGKTATPEPTDTPTPTPTNTPTPEPTDEPTPEPTDEPTPEPTSEPTPQPTDEPTPEPTDEPTMADLSGQVIVAGRADNDWSDTVVTINDNGQIATTDAAGNFSIINVAAGSLDTVTADAPGYLPAVCTGLTVTAPKTVLEAINLLSGDINDDSLVDITDATAVGAGFGQTGSNLPADITRDDVLDIFDIVLVSVNFGEKGPQTWSCLD